MTTPASNLKSLLDAAYQGDSNAVREKLNSRIVINSREDDPACPVDLLNLHYYAMGQTCLNQAISGSAPPEVIEELLMRGADPTLQAAGNLPIGSAIAKRNVETVELLLRHKASVNTPDCRGYTPMLSALRLNNLEVFNLLLNHRADYDKIHRICFMSSNLQSRSKSVPSIRDCISQGKIDFLFRQTTQVSPEIREAFQQHLASKKGEDKPLSDTSAAAAAPHIVSGSPASDENTKKDTFKA